MASAIASSSVITDIAVNQQKNVIQHSYWGKIFPFQDDYACILSILFNTNNFINSIYQKSITLFKDSIPLVYCNHISFVEGWYSLEQYIGFEGRLFQRIPTFYKINSTV